MHRHEHKPAVEEAARGLQRHDLADDALGEHAARRVVQIGKAGGHLEEHRPYLHRQKTHVLSGYAKYAHTQRCMQICIT